MLRDLLGRGPADKERSVLSLTVIVKVLGLHMLAEKLPQLESPYIKPTLASADTLRWTSHLTYKDTEPFLFEMKTRSYSNRSLGPFEIDRVGMTRDTAKAILIPLMFCILHLVQIDEPFMKMWKERDSWKLTVEGMRMWKSLEIVATVYGIHRLRALLEL